MLIDLVFAASAQQQVQPNYGSAAFFGMLGVSLSIIFANVGAAIGTAQSGIGICSLGILRPEMIVKSIVPVVMAGILGIYGLIVSVILIGKIKSDSTYTLHDGFKFLASGACCGLSGLAAGFAIGYVGDSGVRANGRQEQIFVGMILMLIFGEAIGLYGLIVAIILSQG